LAVTLTGGNRNDTAQLLPLLDATPPIRGPARPAPPPTARAVRDRGYDHDVYRRQLRQRGITRGSRLQAWASGAGWWSSAASPWLHALKRLRNPLRTPRRRPSWPTSVGLRADLLPTATYPSF